VVLAGALAAGLCSGALTALAFPPADLGPLAFISLTPLAFVFMRATPPVVAAASAAFGLTFFGLLLSWIRLFGPAAYVGLLIVETGFVVLALAGGRWVMQRLPPRWKLAGPLAFPVAFVAGEYLRSRLPFGGFGWGGLGYSQHNNLPLLRLASYTGVWGVSLVLAATALLAERALTSRPSGTSDPSGPPRGQRRDLRWRLACVAGGAALAAAPALLPVPSPGGRSARIALVQGSAPEASAGPHADDRAVLRSHADLTRSVAGRRYSLVVWPESSVDLDPFLHQDVHDLLVDSVRAIRTPVLVGATTDEPINRFRNSSLLFAPDGSLEARYDKQHLGPFGEYVPFRRLLVPLVSELQRVPRDGVAGKRATVFALPGGRLAAAICFESTFPTLIRQFVAQGARLLVVSTNDSSYKRTAAARQHLAFAELRAAEHRMWVVQAALTGISSFVEPSGRAVNATGLFQRTVVEGDVRFATGRTVYGRLGDWLPLTCLVALGAGALAATFSRRPGPPATAPAAPGSPQP
jgi:apolipoprotein N-acyltransferase